MRMTRLTTMASTGRLTKMSVNFMAALQVPLQERDRSIEHRLRLLRRIHGLEAVMPLVVPYERHRRLDLARQVHERVDGLVRFAVVPPGAHDQQRKDPLAMAAE